MAGVQSYSYHKISALFTHIFKNETQEYHLWMSKRNSNFNIDNNKYKKHNNLIIRDKKNINEDNQYNDNIHTNVDTNKRGRKKIMYKANVDLYKKLVDDFMSIYNRLNEGQHEDLQIDFGLHFDARGNYSGRSMSHFCLTLNEKKEQKDDSTMEKRSVFLKRVGLSDYKEIYDIKSEVPRVTILANTGIWKADDYDIYEAIINECDFLYQEQISREEIKKLFMRIYFGTGTVKQRYNYYRNDCIRDLQLMYGLTCKACKKEKCESRNKRLKCENHTVAKNYYYKHLEEYHAEYTFEYWKEMSRAVEKVIGKSLGNLIFWWTSLIQVYTIYQILEEKNIRVYNVYDGFYAANGCGITKEYVADMVKKSALYVYENYMKGVKSAEIV
jgi:hypothetical protein